MYQLETSEASIKPQHHSSVYCADNSRPLLICEHSLHAPARAKYVKRLGETVIVNQPRVDGEKAHH